MMFLSHGWKLEVWMGIYNNVIQSKSKTDYNLYSTELIPEIRHLRLCSHLRYELSLIHLTPDTPAYCVIFCYLHPEPCHFIFVSITNYRSLSPCRCSLGFRNIQAHMASTHNTQQPCCYLPIILWSAKIFYTCKHYRLLLLRVWIYVYISCYCHFVIFHN